MKKFLFIAVSLLLIGGTAAAAERIVFVDLEQVFNEFYKTKLAKAKIEAQREDVQEERQVMVDEMNAISAKVDERRKEARDVTLSQDIRDEKRLLYEELLIELRDQDNAIAEFTQLRQKQYQTQVTRMSQTLMDEIRKTIVDYAQTEGLQAVIDSSARGAQLGVFVYTHPDADITETILMVLNSQQPDLEGENLLEIGNEEAQETDDSGEEPESHETE